MARCGNIVSERVFTQYKMVEIGVVSPGRTVLYVSSEEDVSH